MNLKALKKFDVKDYELSKTLDNITEFLNQIMPNPFLAGSAVSSIVNSSGKVVPLVLGATTVMVPHSLGADYSGYLVTYQNAGESVFVDESVTKTGAGELNSKAKFIPLKATGTVTVKLWIF